MIKPRRNLLVVGTMALDIVALVFAFLAAYEVRDTLLPRLLF